MESAEPKGSGGRTRRVLVVGAELFFLTRIQTTAKAVGVITEECALARAQQACITAPPDLVILDLRAPEDPLPLVRALKADETTRAIPVVGYYSHVEGATRRAALEAGVDQVMPRSAFTAKLAEILRG